MHYIDECILFVSHISLSRFTVYLAMKQYRRSRPEASRNGVRRAKALLEGEKETGTGRRMLNSHGGIPSHPLLRRVEIDKITASLEQSSGGSDLSKQQKQENEKMAKKKISDLQKRQDFLHAMANFRPKETVFEAFATGGQKDLIYNAQVDKCANGSAAALVAMKRMRRQMKIARDKGSALVIAGSKSANELNGDEVDLEDAQYTAESNDDGDEQRLAVESAIPIQPVVDTKPTAVKSEGKRRLSKAERKKMKKNPNYKPDSSEAVPKKSKGKRGADFRDDTHFIDNDITNDTAAAARSRQMEAAMQPSASSSAKGSAALAYRIEGDMLDIVGDENVDLVKKQRMMRWDKSKRKYMQTTVGEELSGDSKSKKMRLESGQLVKRDKANIGELYEKWQKKTNKSIGRTGVFDDVVEDGEGIPEVKAGKNKKATKGKSAGDDERKTAIAIRKEREKKEDMRVKNMKKGDRRQLERKQRSEAQDGPQRKKGPGKKGPSTRWGGQKKKGIGKMGKQKQTFKGRH